MFESNANIEDTLRQHLSRYSSRNEDYWSFRGKAVREHAHAFLQYPAMMVPQMQGELIRIIKEHVPGIRSVYDPFAGSGTVMIEAMLQGLNFKGQDINPLAILICHAKKGPYYEVALERKIDNLFQNIQADKNETIDIDFTNIFKWFKEDVAGKLSRIRRSIKKESSKWARRFFWVALAETVRLTCNSRTSTFKLHIRPAEEIASRDVSPIKIFESIVSENFRKFSQLKKLLEKKGLLQKCRFSGSIDVELADSSKESNDHGERRKKYDLLVTSPPYGDNVTTVPYGQYSYLPLQWIDMSDIAGKPDNSFLATTHEIDSRSLGGKKTNAMEDSQELKKISKTFSQIIDNLQDEPRDRIVRVAAFCRDLDKSIDPITAALKPGAYMIWTIGNRQVGRKIIRMDNILTELLIARGARNIVQLQRKIPSKRMAVKNNFADTIRTETIMVLKKGNC